MIEREEHAATVDTIDQLASALGVSPMDLLDPDAATR